MNKKVTGFSEEHGPSWTRPNQKPEEKLIQLPVREQKQCNNIKIDWYKFIRAKISNPQVGFLWNKLGSKPDWWGDKNKFIYRHQFIIFQTFQKRNIGLHKLQKLVQSRY